MTTDSPAQPERSLDLGGILEDYQRRLSEATHQVVLQRAHTAAAEAECAQLRLRVIELEAAQPA